VRTATTTSDGVYLGDGVVMRTGAPGMGDGVSEGWEPGPEAAPAPDDDDGATPPGFVAREREEGDVRTVRFRSL